MPIAPKTFQLRLRAQRRRHAHVRAARQAQLAHVRRLPRAGRRARGDRTSTTRCARSSSPARGARSARAATSNDIIGELFARDMQGLARVHAHDRARSSRTSASCAARSSPRSTASRSARARSSPWRATSGSPARRASFGFIFPKVGLCGADMGAGYLLPRIVGLARASELLFLGDRIDAADAPAHRPRQPGRAAGRVPRRGARRSPSGSPAAPPSRTR